VKPGGGTPVSTANEGKKNPNMICFNAKKGLYFQKLPQKNYYRRWW